ncbi:chorismate mutase [Salidesulfovibrio onnuriiensis]|uniref:chorismate mutase n=1 Tax=Salidesulfovibrio onnuriiensis TaxID=2583823 RepID=UPI00202B3108|nr:chorismate mutase [Salidesulfovibrio onnuriiensis]
MDRKILSFIEQRAAILRREGSWRRSKQMSKVDPQLEKMLRASWEEAGTGLGLDPRLSRQVFGLLNQFALQQGRTASPTGAYNLAPGREPAQARIDGPRSRRLSCMWAAMAASAGQSITLENVSEAGSVKDFAKALSQAGVASEWQDNALRILEGDGMAFENAMIFAGGDKLNFYLLLTFAMGYMGRCKFTGQPLLQMLDLGPLNKLLPKLGARLATMNPNNPGLPARLESGGPMDEDVTMLPGIDAEFTGALALAAWSFPGGLTIKGIAPAHRPAVEDAVCVLRACGIDAELKKDTCTVSDGIPEIPSAPELPLDVELASTLLALPAFSGGFVEIAGAWPETAQAAVVRESLESMGVTLEAGDDGIKATGGDVPRGAEIKLGVYPELYPLALACGLRSGNAVLSGGPVPEVAVELLDRMNADYDADEETLTLRSSRLDWGGAWDSPGIGWTLACALLAYVRPQIALTNHTEVTSEWPQFWNFYNSLPTGRMKPKPVKEDPNEKRRRIKVR